MLTGSIYSIIACFNVKYPGTKNFSVCQMAVKLKPKFCANNASCKTLLRLKLLYCDRFFFQQAFDRGQRSLKRLSTSFQACWDDLGMSGYEISTNALYLVWPRTQSKYFYCASKTIVGINCVVYISISQPAGPVPLTGPKKFGTGRESIVL